MQTKTIRFIREKETKNTVKFDEQPGAGQPPVVGSLYVQKWFVGPATELSVTIANTAEAQPTGRFGG